METNSCGCPCKKVGCDHQVDLISFVIFHSHVLEALEFDCSDILCT